MNNQTFGVEMLTTPETSADGIFVCTNIKIKLDQNTQRQGHVSQCFRFSQRIETRTFNLRYSAINEENVVYIQSITVALVGTQEMRSGSILNAHFEYNINSVHTHIALMYIHDENIISSEQIELLDKNIYCLTSAEVIDQDENKSVIL